MRMFPLLSTAIKLRLIKARLLRTQGEGPSLDLSTVRKEIESRLTNVNPATVQREISILETYVDLHVANWLTRLQARHQAVNVRLDTLAAQLAEAEQVYLGHQENQTNVLNDLEAAVSHALERVARPDSPFFAPEPRNRRGWSIR